MEIDFKPKFFEALRNYSKEKFAADLMAGIIVGIVALPLRSVSLRGSARRRDLSQR